ncbi:MAG: hypothetical protein U5K79_22750 [Cyclobacteriaceae bacterium]|nr:hypothetical protein [Cyclobacteriaceae bacterium]
MKQRLVTIHIALLLLLSSTGLAQQVENSELFANDELLAITLKTDLRKLINTKMDPEYQDGEITMNGKTYPIQLKARGNNRRETCSFPPITLDFSKTEFEDPSYDQLEKLKLVNSCKMLVSYEQYILREYLIYRSYQLFTDKSFKVKLLRIDYVDAKEKIKTVTRYGFVIEDQYMMASRLDGVMVKKEGIRDQSTNRETIVMMSIFMYMIGNTDWNIPMLHNMKLLKLNKLTETAPYAVPYDFDYTGMVNADYAVPSPILGIETLRQRLFWGKCYGEEELKTAINLFISKKQALYALYENFPYFDKSSLYESTSFLDSFYKIIEDEKRWKPVFMKECKE